MINIGHGDPTIFRTWWQNNSIAPPIFPSDLSIFEYQEDEHEELSVAVHKFHKIFGTDCSTSSLVYGNGSTQVINAILYAIAKLEQQKIIVAYEPPVYMLMHEFLDNCKLLEVTHDITRTDIDVEIVIDPNNPSGESRSHKSKAKYILYDRAYNWPIYLGNTLPSPTSNNPNHITVYTISKALGMGGLRLGWAFINDTVLLKEIHRALFVIGICPSSYGIKAVTKILTQFNNTSSLVLSYTHNIQKEINLRRRELIKCKDFSVTNSTGPYAWIKSHDGSDIAALLLNKYQIKVYSGTQFAYSPEYARLSLICSDEEFYPAVHRMQ